MPDFVYQAMARTGAKSTGTIAANSEREAAMALDAKGLYPLEITRSRTQTTGAGSGGFFAKRVKGRHLATFYSQLADLLHTGVPLLRSLELLERQSTNPTLQSVLREIRGKVADGTGLAQAMAAFPRVFNELAVSMVRAGQEGGFLEDVLKRIAIFIEHQEDMKAKVIGAMAYPVFLGLAGFAVLNILVIFFVPKFEPIFAKLKEKDELPTLTHVLDGLQQFLAVAAGLDHGGSHRRGGGLFRALDAAAPAASGPIAAASSLPLFGHDLPATSPCPASPASSARCCTTASRSCSR